MVLLSLSLVARREEGLEEEVTFRVKKPQARTTVT